MKRAFPIAIQGLVVLVVAGAAVPSAWAAPEGRPREVPVGPITPDPGFGEEITVLGDAPFIYPVGLGQPVSIRFGIGEVEIRSGMKDLSVQMGESVISPFAPPRSLSPPSR